MSASDPQPAAPAGDQAPAAAAPEPSAEAVTDAPAADAAADGEMHGAGAADHPDVTPVELNQLEPDDTVAMAGNLELLRDIELTVTVEVGRARLRVRDLLSLHEGSVVELDRPVGSPVDLLRGGRPVDPRSLLA